MRKTIAAIVAGLLSCPTVLAAEPALRVPFAVNLPEKNPAPRPLRRITLHEELQTPSTPGSPPSLTQQPLPENKSWMERHPVWFGLIVGAGVGAGLGAASCGDGCFPIGTSGAAMVGSWYGGGAGALIGWGVGRAR